MEGSIFIDVLFILIFLLLVFGLKIFVDVVDYINILFDIKVLDK